MQFSPFHDNCLATCSTDATVKIWMVPNEGINQHRQNCDADLKGHSKKVTHLKFHPTSEFTLASCGMEGSVKIWDIQNEHAQMSYDGLGQQAWHMNWNYDGSQIAVLTKEKRMHVLDPRSTTSAQSTQAHDGSKAQRLVWLGNSGNIMTHGWSAHNERQYAVFDSRKIETPLVMKKLDNHNLSAWLHYDDASKVLYVINKASTFVQFYYYHETGDKGLPKLQEIDKFVGKDNQQGVFFLPKRNVDFMTNELERAIRFTGKVAEYISFKVKRMSGAFQDELYPPCAAQQHSMTFEEWAAGENKQPILQEFDPNTVAIDQETITRQSTFKNKINLGEAHGQEEEKSGADDLAMMAELEDARDKIEVLNKTVAEL